MAPSVALLAPFGPPSARGNAVTARRIADGLAARGVRVRLWDLSVTPEAVLAAGVAADRPALVHALHGWRVGPVALRLARRLDVPLVVTLTGTDANHDLRDPARAAAVRAVLEGAAVVVAFHPSLAARATAAVPALAGRVRIVPQACVFAGREPFDLDARWARPDRDVLFLLPGGIRAVKRPGLALAGLAPVAALRPGCRLLYAGPVIEPAEGEALSAALAPHPWARHVGVVPPPQMASLLARADVVLNCSLSEGGMANSVLEALALGRAVLASDIEGNRSLVQDDVTGLLFGDTAGLGAQAERLARDGALRQRLGAAGRALVERLYPPEREIDGYLEAYREATPACVA